MDLDTFKPERVDIYRESPYRLHITMNSAQRSGMAAQLRDEIAQYMHAVQKDLLGVAAAASSFDARAEELNAIHNRLCAENIKWRKELDEKHARELEQKKPRAEQLELQT